MQEYRNVIRSIPVYTDLLATKCIDLLYRVCRYESGKGLDVKSVGFKGLHRFEMKREPVTDENGIVYTSGQFTRSCDVISGFLLGEEARNLKRVTLEAGFTPRPIYTDEEAKALTTWTTVAEWKVFPDFISQPLSIFEENDFGIPQVCATYTPLRIRVHLKNEICDFVNMGYWGIIYPTSVMQELAKNTLIGQELRFTGTDWCMCDGIASRTPDTNDWNVRVCAPGEKPKEGEKLCFVHHNKTTGDTHIL